MTNEELNNMKREVVDATIFSTKEVLTSDEVARYMGISKSYLYKLTMKAAIPCYRPMGKLVYFNRREIETWLQSNRAATDTELTDKANRLMAKKGGVA